MDYSTEIPSIMTLQSVFKQSEDVQFQNLTIDQTKLTIISCDAMFDQNMLYSFVIPQIERYIADCNGILNKDKLLELPIPDIQECRQIDDIVSAVFVGKVIFYFQGLHFYISCDIANKPNRSIEETKMEVLVKGPRDNFIENITVNIALIRKRIPTKSLCVEKLQIGRRSKTTVAILYFDDIANKTILNQIKEQFNQIDIDILVNGDTLMEYFNKNHWFFPWTNDTGRPDFAIQSLVRGRFVILVDGVSYAMVTPVDLHYLLKSSEDFDYPVFFGSFERMLRMFGLFLGITFPAFWLALTTFHQNQLPLQLLATVVVSNVGIPFPTSLEMVFILIMFEMLREAGMRLPSVIGGTVSVVGGLIIGDAAIRAGITSPAMLVVIALSFIATFTMANQSLLTVITLVRLVFILVTSFLGLFGFFCCLYFLILYLANLRVFGVPYLNISADLSWKKISKTLFRLPNYLYKKRPIESSSQDETRTNNEGTK